MFLLPLVSMGKGLGIIAVLNLEDTGLDYSEADQQLAQSIVDATASTLSNLLYMEKQDAIIAERTSEITKKNKELEDVVAELKHLSHEKELILNSAGEGIFGLDLERKITFCNPAGKSMLGYETKGELIGKPYKEIFDKIKSPEADLIADYIEAKEEQYSAEGYFIRKIRPA